ncbi:MAG: hypothetical protein LBG30_06550 [Odoribacteraceae bacterium]|jgi:hypothetical protein|nr:hypothetical protein [Odoribacteraceae bacterium]
MKTTLLVLAAALLAIPTATAQRPPRYTVATHVTILGSVNRLSLEKRLNDAEWLQVGLAAYSITNRDDHYLYTALSNGEEFTRLRGAGASFRYKRFFLPRYYYGAELAYNHYRVRYTDNIMRAYREDDLTFHEYLVNVPLRQTFNKLSSSVTVGFQYFFPHLIFADIFTGLGYSHSFYDSSRRPYNDGLLTFGYRGFYPVLDLRFGIYF